MLGALFALISAATFGLNNAATRRGVLVGTVMQGMAITVPMGVLLFGVAAWIAGSLGAVLRFSNEALIYFALAGFGHFVFGRYCNYRAIAAIGTNLASPLQQWEVLVTLVLALVFLGERLAPIQIVAIALLVLGPVLATRLDQTPKARDVDAAAVAKPFPVASFQPRYAEGYTYAFLTIFGYGSSPILIRAGLQAGSVGDSLAAGLVSYIAATAIVVVAIAALRQVRHVADVAAEPARWFVFAGFLVFASQMFRYMALALVPASIVAPIMRLQTLFRIYFSWVLSPEHEVFDRNVIIGTVISLFGAMLLAVQTDWLLTVLPLPDSAQAVLRWRWP